METGYISYVRKVDGSVKGKQTNKYQRKDKRTFGKDLTNCPSYAHLKSKHP